MGVTCVSQMPVAEGKSVQQTVEILTRKLELLGAEKQGTFGVDCETYHTASSTMGNQEVSSELGHPFCCLMSVNLADIMVASTKMC
ncbi:UNVERIFIED_CONTAM: mediator complex subunit Med20 [Gekko kuhli]